MWASAAVGLAAGPAIAAWGVLTQDGANQVAAAALGAASLMTFLLVGTRRAWLNTTTGTLETSTCGIRVRRIAWSDAETVRIRDNRAGGVVLAVRGAGQRTPTHVALAAADLGGPRSQPPAVLRLLAGQLEAWAPHQRRVIAELHAQADHVERGGACTDSPLVRTHALRRNN